MFSRSKTRGIVDQKEDQIHTRNIIIGVLTTFSFLLTIALIVYPKNIEISYPSDLTKFTTQGVGTKEKHQVFGFTSMAWQQLNNWRGNDELYTPNNQINRFRCFMTDQFFNDLLELNETEKNQRRGRSRNLTLLPDSPFDPDTDVIPLGNNTWDVTLDTLIYESKQGAVIKDGVPMRYQFRVIYSKRDPECNEWGYLISRMNDKPRRIFFNK